jgi:dolichol-phosphate mannosyltransferase
MIHLVIPAYNEEENVDRLFERLVPVANNLGARILIVDDGSSDGTVAGIARYEERCDVRVVRHGVNKGLGAAVATGMAAALEGADDDDAIVLLEADTTSDLETLPSMLELFGLGTDVVVASVHAPGGAIIGVARWRIVASRAVSTVFRWLGGLREVHTLSGLYRVYRAGTLRRLSASYQGSPIRESGFTVNVELLLKLKRMGATMGEVPTVNDWTSRAGVSKLRTGKTAKAYVRLLRDHLLGRLDPPQPFLRRVPSIS